MTFAALRQHVLETTALSTDWFGEDAACLVPGDAVITLTVKVEWLDKAKRPGSQPQARQQVDTAEKIRVMISHDPDCSGGYLRETPLVGTRLTRSESVDADVRPWVYAGEAIARTPLFGVYVFERARRNLDARGR